MCKAGFVVGIAGFKFPLRSTYVLFVDIVTSDGGFIHHCWCLAFAVKGAWGGVGVVAIVVVVFLGVV